MPNPVHVEKIFRELNSELAQIASVKHRLTLLRNFIEILNGEFRSYGSYLLQVMSEFPLFTSPLTFSGKDPAQIEQDLKQFDRIIEQVPEMREIESFVKGIEKSRQVCLILYACLGEMDKVRTLLKEWFGIDVKLKEDDRIETIQGNTSLRRFYRTLASLDEKKFKYESRAITILNSLQSEVRELITEKPQTLLIPAVERFHDLDRNIQTFGRMRRITVKKNQENSRGEDRIIRRFNVVGVEQPYWIEDPEVALAARTLFSYHNQKPVRNYYLGEIFYEMSGAIHVGNSANAAIALLWYTALQNRYERRYKFTSQLAITGDLDAEANLIAVDSSGIDSKAEAVFYSWSPALVVPKTQLDLFEKAVDRLSRKYPDRNLQLLGISNLKELFYDRRYAIVETPSRMEYALTLVKRKKFGAVIFMLIIFLAMIMFLAGAAFLV